ncbi:MAG: hypothetical protein QOJ07_1152 [Thermoleophilaceae bacterium]|nr:hypothetical protein [Thermoleophilaceae bacterium]
MYVQWFGQSAFLLRDDATTVFVDPFGSAEALGARAMRWDYPAIADVDADLLLITHEHFDHNNAAAVGGDPAVIRSTAGRIDSPVGEVVAVASEHDQAAGTQRGPNSVFVFTLGGLRVCHMGDFGQAALRDEQAEAIGAVDVLFAPVGAGPTIGPEQAAGIATALGARIVVPMHYRTAAIDFLDPVDPFLALYGDATRLETPSFETSEIEPGSPRVVVPAPPG